MRGVASYCEVKSGDLPRRGVHARKDTDLNRLKRHAPVNPSFLAVDAQHFRRTLSVGVTFLDATSVDPDIFPAVIFGKLATISNLVPAIFPVLLVAGNVFEGNLIVAPNVAQNGILVRKVDEFDERLS